MDPGALQAALDAFAATLPEELAEAFDVLRTRREARDADPLSPLGHPVLLLAGWTAAAVGRPSDAAVGTLSAAAAFGYLHVSVQDAWVDEGLGDPVATLFLSDRLRARHESLVRDAVGADPRYWAEHEAVWARYGAAMVLERRLHQADRSLGDAEHARILDRSMPLVLPGLGVLSVAHRWDLLPGLTAFVRHVVTAGQLWDDLVDLEVDRAAGRYTRLVRRLGGLAGPAELVAGLLSPDGLDAITDEALAHLDGAERAAAGIGLPAGDFLAARRDGLEAWRQETWGRLFQILGGAGPETEVVSAPEAHHGRQSQAPRDPA